MASDRRVKKNIKENVPGLAFINLLKPVTYNADIHKADEIKGYPMKRDSAGNSIGVPDTSYWEGKYDGEKTSCTGLIAQQVDSAAQQIGYDFQGIYRPKHGKDMYGLDYTKFVMPLIKAVQELSKSQDSLMTIIANLQGGGSGQRRNDNGTGGTAEYDIDLASTQAVIYQNAPNPFGDGTMIKYFIPENASAQIVFFDEFGNKLKEFNVAEKGMGQLNVSATNLAAGMYSYSLIVNGKAVDTKKMIKTH